MPTNQAELADVGRLARRLLNRAVETARTEDQPLRRLLLDHLGPDAPVLPAASATWPAYEHVNVQVGLDAWLAGVPGSGSPGVASMRCTASQASGSCARWRSSGSASSSSLRTTARSARLAWAA